MKWTRHDEAAALDVIEKADKALQDILDTYPGDEAGALVRENAAKILAMLGFIIVALEENWASSEET